MNDFFDDVSKEINKNEVPAEKPTEQKPELIKLGDQEYKPDELSKLVGLGNKYQEIEEKYNTKLDKVWPEYTKSQNRVKELEEENEKLKTPPAPANPEDLSPQQLAEARSVLEKVLGGPIMTKTEFRNAYMAERAGEKLLEDSQDLESQYDGKDGRPAYKTETVLRHMAETGIKNPEKAYKDLYETELDTWRTQQLEKEKKPGIVTQTGSSGGSKEPPIVKITAENLDQLIRESLEGGN